MSLIGIELATPHRKLKLNLNSNDKSTENLTKKLEKGFSILLLKTFYSTCFIFLNRIIKLDPLTLCILYSFSVLSTYYYKKLPFSLFDSFDFLF